MNTEDYNKTCKLLEEKLNKLETEDLDDSTIEKLEQEISQKIKRLENIERIEESKSNTSDLTNQPIIGNDSGVFSNIFNMVSSTIVNSFVASSTHSFIVNPHTLSVGMRTLSDNNKSKYYRDRFDRFKKSRKNIL